MNRVKSFMDFVKDKKDKSKIKILATVRDYLLDVLPDEGHSDWNWKGSDLKKACHKVFDSIK